MATHHHALYYTVTVRTVRYGTEYILYSTVIRTVQYANERTTYKYDTVRTVCTTEYTVYKICSRIIIRNIQNTRTLSVCVVTVVTPHQKKLWRWSIVLIFCAVAHFYNL